MSPIGHGHRVLRNCCSKIDILFLIVFAHILIKLMTKVDNIIICSSILIFLFLYFCIFLNFLWINLYTTFILKFWSETLPMCSYGHRILMYRDASHIVSRCFLMYRDVSQCIAYCIAMYPNVSRLYRDGRCIAMHRILYRDVS